MFHVSFVVKQPKFPKKSYPAPSSRLFRFVAAVLKDVSGQSQPVVGTIPLGNISQRFYFLVPFHPDVRDIECSCHSSQYLLSSPRNVPTTSSSLCMEETAGITSLRSQAKGKSCCFGGRRKSGQPWPQRQVWYLLPS